MIIILRDISIPIILKKGRKLSSFRRPSSAAAHNKVSRKWRGRGYRCSPLTHLPVSDRFSHRRSQRNSTRQTYCYTPPSSEPSQLTSHGGDCLDHQRATKMDNLCKFSETHACLYASISTSTLYLFVSSSLHEVK